VSARKLTIYGDDTLAWHLIEADANLALAHLPADSVDAIVTDPPYGIGIVGERWDRSPGGEAFERWTRAWAEQCRRVLKPGGFLLAFGAPRTFHRLASGVENAGLEIRDVVLWLYGQGLPKSRRLPGGQGTALKPAYEPILLARTPIVGTLPENVARYGTGALNVEAASIGSAGYWPANLTYSHSPDCPAALIAEPTVGVSRLFYCAKATRAEREAGCSALPVREVPIFTGRSHKPRLRRNTHPTVKPIALMRWLIRLAVPAGGVVLDPFCGSGTTGIAAVSEGRQFIGVEREGQYVEVACARLTHWAATCGTQRESLS
jgi:site-specific DNA-methyltransferase (adenine-specific)